MNEIILEADLLQLRKLVAVLYGEDTAQDTMVRVLSRKYREHWFKRELFIAKRKWQQKLKRENLLKPFDETEILQEDDTERILSWIELRARASKEPDFLRLMLIELGIQPVAHRASMTRLRKCNQRESP
ncbi:hypothetical protein LCGC14_2718510 [marine sediment metagenome]|uniref:Uncharacterized protein n=1 Tax=marine sediment metagenome TaxID=412755 RepID=A0A0F9C2M2_9ZZZZ